MLVEVVGGLYAGSLALLADAGHMLTDAAALALSWGAFRIARRPADARRSFGYQRFEVLAAFVNALALLAIIAWIGVEAVQRFLSPTPVRGEALLLVAFLGLLVNLASLRLLHGGDQNNLNLRGATLHVLGDLLGSVAALIAGAVILLTDWTPIDPLLSLLVCLLILRSAWALLRQSTHILLEGAPGTLDREEIRSDLMRHLPQVLDVHHVHLWALSPARPLITLHVKIEAQANDQEVLKEIKSRLHEGFGLDHATVEIERG